MNRMARGAMIPLPARSWRGCSPTSSPSSWARSCSGDRDRPMVVHVTRLGTGACGNSGGSRPCLGDSHPAAAGGGRQIGPAARARHRQPARTRAGTHRAARLPLVPIDSLRYRVQRALSNAGITEFSAEGPFDPTRHHAADIEWTDDPARTSESRERSAPGIRTAHSDPSGGASWSTEAELPVTPGSRKGTSDDLETAG